jgi:hypothetical protein
MVDTGGSAPQGVRDTLWLGLHHQPRRASALVAPAGKLAKRAAHPQSRISKTRAVLGQPCNLACDVQEFMPADIPSLWRTLALWAGQFLKSRCCESSWGAWGRILNQQPICLVPLLWKARPISALPPPAPPALIPDGSAKRSEVVLCGVRHCINAD